MGRGYIFESITLFASFAMVFLLQLTVQTTYAANSIAPNVIFTLNVPSVCEISLTGSISFGTVLAGSNTLTTSQNVLDINNGNQGASIAVSGSNWIGTNALNTFGVSNTVWSAGSGVAFGAANVLTTIPANTGIAIDAGSRSNVWFGLGIPEGQVADSYTQNIIITNLC